mgnify:CR=1 FL=1
MGALPGAGIFTVSLAVVMVIWVSLDTALSAAYVPGPLVRNRLIEWLRRCHASLAKGHATPGILLLPDSLPLYPVK